MRPLPTPLTPLIGREQEIAELKSLLEQKGMRLVTLTGTGGVGKTRLALAAAYALTHSFVDGACFISLSAIQEQTQVLPAFVLALDIESEHPSLEDALLLHLRAKRLLLVIDSMEQVRDAAPWLASLVLACPSLILLVTSRERLRVEEEQEYLVRPFPVPDPATDSTAILLQHHAAIMLFVERAKAVRSDFALTDANASTIAHICARLDGLPLALELAAARINLFSPLALLTRLSQRLPTLTMGRRDAPERHHSLRAAIEWSYALLSDAEQTLLQRLSLFVGGSTVQALEELYRELGDNSAPISDLVTALHEKHLIVRETPPSESPWNPDGEPRLSMLETIRDFGLEELAISGMLRLVQQAWTCVILCWAERGRAALFSSERLVWIKWFQQERENLHGVLHFLIEQQAWDQVLHLGAYLGPFWVMLGSSSRHVFLDDGREWLEPILEGSAQMTTSDRGWCLAMYGEMLALQGEWIRGEAACQKGLALCRQTDDLQGTIGALWMLEDVYRLSSDFRQARQVADEAVALCQQNPTRDQVWAGRWTLGFSLQRAGYIATWTGNYQYASVALQEGSQCCQQEGDYYVVLLAHLCLGQLAYFEGKTHEARQVLEACGTLLRCWNMTRFLSESLIFQGMAVLHEGDLDGAEALLLEGLQLAQEVHDLIREGWATVWLARLAEARHQFEEAHQLLLKSLPGAEKAHRVLAAFGLETMGHIAMAQRKPRRAIHLLGAADALRAMMGVPLPPVDQRKQAYALEKAHQLLGLASYQRAWQQGHTMTLEQVLNPSSTEKPSSLTEPSHGVAVSEPHTRLTPRERETLQWLVAGLKNSHIAKRMGLSVVTVNSHLRSIYNKLGVSSRSQAVCIAREQKLL